MLASAFVLIAMSQNPTTQTSPGKQVSTSVERRITRTIRLNYYLYLPDDYEKRPRNRWPVILFLHGSGESGIDLDKIKVHGPPKEIENGRKLPFIVVSPQSPDSWYWDPYPLLGLLDEIEAKYRVDKDRIYLTGLSMGGRGSYRLAALAPDRFAAVAPIAGGANPIYAPALKNLPIWATHGAKDQSVPIAEDQGIVDALKALNADVKFTVVAEGGHDVWSDVYAGTEIYDWFLAHKRKKLRGKPGKEPHPGKTGGQSAGKSGGG